MRSPDSKVVPAGPLALLSLAVDQVRRDHALTSAPSVTSASPGELPLTPRAGRANAVPERLDDHHGVHPDRPLRVVSCAAGAPHPALPRRRSEIASDRACSTRPQWHALQLVYGAALGAASRAADRLRRSAAGPSPKPSRASMSAASTGARGDAANCSERSREASALAPGPSSR